jgi:hypothetical protein
VQLAGALDLVRQRAHAEGLDVRHHAAGVQHRHARAAQHLRHGGARRLRAHDGHQVVQRHGDTTFGLAAAARAAARAAERHQPGGWSARAYVLVEHHKSCEVVI